MPSPEKEKGKRFERVVKGDIAEFMPGEKVRRGLQSANSAEVEVVPDVICPLFWIECKHRKVPDVRAALRQAIEDAQLAGSDKIPVAIVKKDRESPTVTMPYEDWLEMARIYYECSSQ